MNRNIFIAMLVLTVLAVAGCLPKATEQECSDMCANLAVLKADTEAKPLDKQLASIEESYAKRIVDTNTRKDTTIADLDKQMADKLAAAKTDAEKKTITDEYAPLKETATKDAETAIADLETRKAEEVKSVTENAAAAKAEAEKLITECKTQCAAEGTFQKIAQCRIEAKDIDTYYNRCR